MPIDYKQGQIYKLWSPDNLEMVYVGSTCQPLYQRLSQHKRGWKGWKTGKRYYASCDMFENCQEVKIELVELCPCNSKIELHRTEGKYIREMDCINKRVAGRTMKEYREDYKEALIQQNKQYRQANRDKIKARKKIKITCECGSVVRKNDIARHRRTHKHQRFINQQ